MVGKNGEGLSAPATPTNGNEAVEKEEEEEELNSLCLYSNLFLSFFTITNTIIIVILFSKLPKKGFSVLFMKRVSFISNNVKCRSTFANFLFIGFQLLQSSYFVLQKNRLTFNFDDLMLKQFLIPSSRPVVPQIPNSFATFFVFQT